MAKRHECAKIRTLILRFVVMFVLTGNVLAAGNEDLYQAAVDGNLGKVEKLIAANAGVNSVASNGSYALIAASFKGHVGVVRVLIAANADVNVKTKNGITALILSSQQGHVGVVKMLLAAKADVDAKAVSNSITALILSSQNGQVEVVRELLAANADVNARMDGGYTSLMMASQNNHLPVVQELLAATADVNAMGDDGATALVLSSQNGHREVVKALLAAGAKPSRDTYRNVSSLSPLEQPSNVASSQQKLKNLGYDPGPVDGQWGKRTRAALKLYQKTEGLKVTGSLDAETLSRLGVVDEIGSTKGSFFPFGHGVVEMQVPVSCVTTQMNGVAGVWCPKEQ